MFIEKVIEKISEQQQGRENTAVYYVGEQLKDICRSSDKVAEIVLQDLDNPDMSIVKAEAQINKYADEHHGKEKCYCVTPDVAESIIKKFYGVENFETSSPKETKEDYINLDDFVN